MALKKGENALSIAPAETPFWEKPLAELTRAEWEKLCDGCGRCCLVKLEDDDTGAIYHTSVACKLLDQQSCRCGDYPRRRKFVPDCVRLTLDKLENIHLSDSNWQEKAKLKVMYDLLNEWKCSDGAATFAISDRLLDIALAQPENFYEAM